MDTGYAINQRCAGMHKATSKKVVDEYTHHKTTTNAIAKPAQPFKLIKIFKAANPNVGNIQYPKILMVLKNVTCSISAIKLNNVPDTTWEKKKKKQKYKGIIHKWKDEHQSAPSVT